MKNKLFLLLMVGAISTFAWVSHPPREAARTPASEEWVPSPVEPEAPSGIGRPTELAFKPLEGRRYTYAFRRRILIQGLDNTMPAIGYRGYLWIDVLSADIHGFTALVSEQMEGQEKNAVALKVKVDRLGKNVEIFSRRWETDEAREHVAILKDLLAQFFFEGHSDTTGEFLFRVDNLAEKDGFLRKQKTKLRYLSGPVEILSSIHLIRWDENFQFPYDLKGSEITRMGRGDGSLSSRSDYLIQFVRVTKANLPNAALLADLSLPDSLRLSQNSKVAGGPTDGRGLSWAEVLFRLRSLDTLSESERLKVFGDLVKLLEKKAVTAAALLDLLHSSGAWGAGASSPLFQTIVGALASAGGEESWAALREIYASPESNPAVKGMIQAALTTTQAVVDNPTRDLLAREMETEANSDLANGAGYALGASLTKLDKAEVEAWIRRILERWRKAKGSGQNEQLATLDVMGNSGRAEFLPSITEASNGGGNPAVRARAVFSLRFIEAPEANQQLAKFLTDEDARMREAAISAIALASWSEIFSVPLAKCAAEEVVSPIKAACVKIVASARRSVAQN